MAAKNDSSPFRTDIQRVSDRELVFRRTFRARPETVFDAMTKPELVERWWAPASLGVILHEITADVRVGGTYRYVFGKQGQPPMAFTGVYRELVRGERIVMTQIFEQMRDAGEAILTATFTPVEAGTAVDNHALYPSKEALAGAIASGMEKGMLETMDQLDALTHELDGAR